MATIRHREGVNLKKTCYSVRYEGKIQKAHRLVYMWEHGLTKLPKGYVLR